MAKNYMLIYGKKSIKERLKVDPKSIRKIFFTDNFSDKKIKELINKLNIPFEILKDKKLQDIRKAKNLQGVIARVDKFSYSDFEDFLNEKNKTLVFLDRINDPQNLGVIIRTLACFGGFSLVLPEKNACHITETVIHVSSGGENYVKVAKVQDMSKAIEKAKKKGFNIVGAVIDKKAKNISSLKLKFPLGLVLGAEATGIDKKLQDKLDQKAYIKMQGADLSFNVNTACTIFCFAIANRR